MSSSAITGPIFTDNKRAPAGTAAAPSFAFNDSTGTGVYLVSPGVLGLSTAGVQAGSVNASGAWTLGPTTYPSHAINGITLFKSSATNGRINIGATNNYIYGDSANNLIMGTAGVDRLLINASGDVLISANNNRLGVGNTASGFGSELVRISRDNTPAASVIEIENRSTSFSGDTCVLGSFRNTTNGSYRFLTCVRQGFAYSLFIYDSGSVANATGSYGGISDEKVKENIVDATPKLDKLKQVRIVNYNLKNDPEKTKMLGVVAQEVEQIFPGLIQEDADKDSEGNDLGTTTKSVKYSIFVPMLIKAMQEQQEIIGKLEARLAALEAK